MDPTLLSMLEDANLSPMFLRNKDYLVAILKSLDRMFRELNAGQVDVAHTLITFNDWEEPNCFRLLAIRDGSSIHPEVLTTITGVPPYDPALHDTGCPNEFVMQDEDE